MGEFLESAGKLVAFATIAVLILSVTYEWGYFNVIGKELQGFVTAYDYLVSTIAWLPALVIVCFFLTWFNYGIMPLAKGRSSVDSLGFHIIGLHFVALTLVVFFWGGAARAEAPYLYTIFFLYIWSALSGRTAAKMLHLGNQFVVLGIGAPVLLSIALGNGIAAGYRDIRAGDYSYSIKLKDEIEMKEAAVLRNLDKGIILKEKDKDRIDFYRWDRIDVVRHSISVPSKSHSCELLGWFC